jgi:uncharacterized protein (TIGR02266 family)
MAEAKVLSLEFESVQALCQWYAGWVAEGSAELPSAQALALGEELTLLLRVKDGRQFRISARRVSPPEGVAEGARVALEPTPELRDFLGWHVLLQRPGRLASGATGRRKSPRFQACLSVRFPSYQKLVDEYVSDLSVGGMFIPTAAEVEVGSRILLELKLPDGDTLTAEAEVVRAVKEDKAADRSAGLGVALVGEASKARAALERLIGGYLARSPRVLVVDADGHFLHRLSEGLLAEGMEVLTAQTGYRAMHLIAHNLFDLDLLVIDLHLPRFDGRALLERVRRFARTVRIPVVLLSARDEAQLAALVGPAGADDALFKGAPMAELVERIKRTVRP